MDSLNVRLRSAGDVLGDACHDINKMLVALEEQAVALNPGSDVEVVISSLDDPSGEYIAYTAMRLAKFSGRWRLLIGGGFVGESEREWDWKPAVEASMANRIDAAKASPKFFERLVVVREKQAEEATSAARTLNDTITLLRTLRGDDE